eukprot:236916_1
MSDGQLTTFKWNLADSDINFQQFKELPQKKYIKSSIFKAAHGLEFLVWCCPNGNRTEGYCVLYLSLKQLPQQYKAIRVYFYLRCKETVSSVEDIAVLQKGSLSIGWRDETLLSSELQSLNNMTFFAGVRILNILNMKNEMVYQLPIYLSNIARKQQLNWQINQLLIQQFKTNRKKKSYFSIKNSNELFTLEICPKADTKIKDHEETAGLFIHLKTLPLSVKKLKIKLTFKCKQNNVQQSGPVIFDYNNKSTGIAKFFASTDFGLYSVLDFIVDIEIFECYDSKDNLINNTAFKKTENIDIYQVGLYSDSDFIEIGEQKQNDNDNDAEETLQIK